MKKISQKISTIIISFFVIVFPALSFAQITNPLGSNSIPDIVTNVLGLIVKVGGVGAIFAFIWSGYLFVKAQGNESELQKAKDTFFYTAIGVGILLGAQLIASIVVGTLKTLK